MANLTETGLWEDGIYQWEEDDPVLGGPTGIDNVPTRQLANRTLFQRIRNVSTWVAAYDYPEHAYVQHGGQTWKSIAASTGVAPGTDPTKWVRWAHTAAELAELLGDSVEAHEAKADPHPAYAFRSGFAAVPAAYVGHVITVTTPHLRQMIWNGTAYVRAPWHQPGMVLYSYDNPASIPGHLPVRADVSYSQANYPDLVARLGLSGEGTFALVELRGEFIRCLDNGRGVDAGRALRSWVAGDNQSHTHATNNATHSHVVNDSGHAHTGWTDAQGYHAHTLSNNGWTGGRNNYAGTPGDTDVGSAVAQTTDPAGNHAHNVGISVSGTGITLSASATGLAIVASGSEARPRSIAFPAWLSY
ncbi:hypothetical protein LJR084_001214 [Variovorax sp. LjRoot84]|uniref:hypothetical protein n=1 Tax=Variovorax sp. LjRoot84 TaxID=3342340 RepID=UPI003ED0C082